MSESLSWLASGHSSRPDWLVVPAEDSHRFNALSPSRWSSFCRLAAAALPLERPSVDSPVFQGRGVTTAHCRWSWWQRDGCRWGRWRFWAHDDWQGWCRSRREDSEEEEGDVWLNNLILQTQADVWSTCCLRESGSVSQFSKGFIPCAIPVEAISCSGSLFACTVALVVGAPSPRTDHAFTGRSEALLFLRPVLKCGIRVRGVWMFQGCCIKVFSRKQESPALSGAEAELCAISISSMEGLLRRVRHIELRAKYIQMLVKKKRLLLEHIPDFKTQVTVWPSHSRLGICWLTSRKR